jgi:hypothetical protein
VRPLLCFFSFIFDPLPKTVSSSHYRLSRMALFIIKWNETSFEEFRPLNPNLLLYFCFSNFVMHIIYIYMNTCFFHFNMHTCMCESYVYVHHAYICKSKKEGAKERKLLVLSCCYLAVDTYDIDCFISR